MPIWIDGDACPKPIKEIVFRAAISRRVETFFVANRFVALPSSIFIRSIQVSSGFDKADCYIIDHVQAADLVITADVLLANHSVTKKAYALNPRGSLYTEATIKQALAMRNFYETMREGGLVSGGQAPLSAKEVQLFSSRLDRWIATKSL